MALSPIFPQKPSPLSNLTIIHFVQEREKSAGKLKPFTFVTLPEIKNMKSETIDFRSDTVTRPGKEMIEQMMQAKVGDDVFGEDTATNELQSYAAALFGMEAALYCPSGTMTNQIAIKTHTQHGQEVVCEKSSHIYVYEGGGIAFNSGCQARTIEGNFGRITAGQIEEVINPDDIHKPHTSLVCLENTTNRGGGACYELQALREIGIICKKRGIGLHLDGARLFNALISKNQKAEDYGKIFDSISICLSKGLGAPVGSLLLGSRSFIDKARRIRKVFGGGTRQSGFIAAAGLYALQHNIQRLAEDHKHAQQIAEALKKKNFIGTILPIETNIIIFEVKGEYSASTLSEKFAEEGILVIPISKSQIRIVLHLDISNQMVEKTIGFIEKL